MNGPSTVNQPTNTNEQLIGKFHVVSVDKLPTNPVTNHEEATSIANASAGGQPAATDESSCASRFQMIRVDRNFARGRWKVNDYEPPENLSTSSNPPVNNMENELPSTSNSTILTATPASASANLPASFMPDSNTASSATLAATAASAAAAAATAFQQQQQQQQQQRLALSNQAGMVPPGNVPPPAGLLHPYGPPTLANMPGPNQPYLLANHPQFGYYPYFAHPYAPYPTQWTALAAANPFLPPAMQPHQQPSPLPSGNLGDPLRLSETDVTSENPVIASNAFPTVTNDPLQNAQMATAAQFVYATHHPHSNFAPQVPPAGASPYATIASYHPGPTPPTIIPPVTQPLSLAPAIPTNSADLQQQQQSHPAPASHSQAPILTSPKHEATAAKVLPQQATIPKTTAPNGPVKPHTTTANGVNTDTMRISTSTAATNPTHIADLLSSSPSMPHSQQQPPPHSLLSPISVQSSTNNATKSPASTLNDIWPYASNASQLHLSPTAAQTAAVTAVAAMGLLNNETGQNTEIANEILKELTTPTKQNNVTDIDNKISAAMDLVKMHLLSAVREEVTELRQQIRTLTEKVTNVEHENAFLRQHVPSEILAQYTPLTSASTAVNDSSNPSTSTSTITPSSASSSQPTPMATLSSLPSALAQQQQPSTATTSQPASAPLPTTSTNLPQT